MGRTVDLFWNNVILYCGLLGYDVALPGMNAPKK